MCGRSPNPFAAAIGNCVASFRRGSQNRPVPSNSRFATNAFQCGIEPQPVQVCRLTPPSPKAGGIKLAPGTFVPVTAPSVSCCGLNALPSRNNSASNFPGPQLLSTVRTVSWLTPKRLATGLRSGASATIPPTFRSRLGQPSSRCPIQPVPGFGSIAPAQSAGRELSTLEWQNEHCRPTDRSVPVQLELIPPKRLVAEPGSAFGWNRP